MYRVQLVFTLSRPVPCIYLTPDGQGTKRNQNTGCATHVATSCKFQFRWDALRAKRILR